MPKHLSKRSQLLVKSSYFNHKNASMRCLNILWGKQIWSNLEHVSLETKLPSTFGLNGHSLSGMKKLLHTSPVEKSCVMYSKILFSIGNSVSL